MSQWPFRAILSRWEAFSQFIVVMVSFQVEAAYLTKCRMPRLQLLEVDGE